MGFMSGAGGFAKGFGDAFASTYSAGLERNARKEAQEEERKYDSEKMLKGQEHDKFMFGLSQAAKDKEELRAQQKREAGWIADAQSISERTGAPVTEVIKRIQAGSNPAVVSEWAASMDWRKSGTVSTPAPAAATIDQQTRSAMPGLDEEYAAPSLEQSGAADRILPPTVSPAVEPAPVSTPVPKADVEIDGYVGTRKVKPQSFDQTTDMLRQNLVDAKKSGNSEAIQQATSELMSAIDVDRMDDKPESLDTDGLYLAAASDDPVLAARANKALDLKERADALKEARSGKGGLFVFNRDTGKLSPAQPVIDENGQRMFVGQDGQPIQNAIQPDDRFYKVYDEVLKIKTEEPYKKYDAKIAATVNVAKASAELAQLVESQPEVLTTTASAVETIKGLSEEAKTIVKVLSTNNAGQITPDEIEKLDRDLNFLSVDTNNLAELSAIYDAKKKVLSYRVAEMNGQSGRDLSNADMGRFDDVIQPSKGKDTVIRNLANLSKSAISDLKPIAATLNSDPRLKDFESTYGPTPLEGGKAAEDFDSYIARMNDPEINQSIEYLRSKEGDITQTEETSGLPKAGIVEEGYRFKGGDPADEANWEKVD